MYFFFLSWKNVGKSHGKTVSFQKFFKSPREDVLRNSDNKLTHKIIQLLLGFFIRAKGTDMQK